jgi:putative oxidoreductase
MKVFNWETTAEHMAGQGMFAVPVFLFLAILVEVLGGLSVILGYKARLGAVVLALYLIPVTLVFHHFWTFEGAAMQNQMQHFMKNLTIIGGLLTLAAAGAGRLSLDAAGEGWSARWREAREREHAVAR